VALEDAVFVTARALGAFNAADQKDGDSGGDQDREETGVEGEPMSEKAHHVLRKIA
jgi:hypothetical protein